MKRILLLCLTAVFMFATFSELWAQSRTVTGKVTAEEDGSTLPGVNVIVKGTTIGTVTDSDGKYSLSIPSAEGAVLVFTFIGLKGQEIPIGSKTTVDLAMAQDANQLSEVIVTGLNIQRESKTLGYSVATVKSELLNQAKVTNLAAALSGKVSGLQINQTDNGVNGSVRVVLRGSRSFLGNNQALIVLDGVQVDNSYLNSINPNDVESVTVLKGANAAALYGSIASNGVLVITTKQGKKGVPEITFSSTLQFDKVAFLPKLQTRFGQNGGEGPGDDVFNINPNYPYGQYVAYENQNYGPEFNGQLVQVGRPLQDGRVQMLTYQNRYKDHLKFWDTGKTQQNDLSFSAGTDNSHFYISAQDVNKTGVMPKDKYRRDVFRFNGDTKYGIFKAAYKVGYTLTDQNVNWTPVNSGNSVYWLWMNTAMNVPLTQYKDWKHNIWASPTGWYDDFYGNPYYNIDNNRRHVNRQDLLGNLELSLQPTKWLNLMARAGVTTYTQHQTDNQGPVVYDLSLANPSKYNANQSKSTNGIIPGSTADYYTSDKRINTDFLATISHSFKENFTVNAIVGGNIFDDYATFNNISASALVYSDPQIFNVSYRTGNLSGYAGSARIRRESIYADASVDYKFVTVHGAWRKDWTSLLAPGNWAFSYPEADIALRITDAIPSLKDNSILSFLKLTASIGKTGNVNVNPYALKTTINAGTPYSVPVMYLGGAVVSSSLKPEFTKSKEIGFELGMWNEKIDFKFNFYQTNTTNQTVPFQVSNSTGYTAALVNVGEMLNRGLEYDLSVTPVHTASGFKWTIGGNFTQILDNRPLYIYTSPTGDVTNRINVLDNGGSGSNSYAVVGYSYPSLLVTDWNRVTSGANKGKVIVDPITGLPSLNPNLVNMGQTNPKYRLGLTTNLSFKGISLSALFDYRAGNVIYNQLGQNIEFGGIGYKSAEAGRQRFVFPNSAIANSDGTYSANTNVTVNEGNYNFWQGLYNTAGSPYVTSAAFWKLRELSLGYQIPSSILEKLKKVKSARISIVGRNLLMWRPKSNQWTDPEYSTDNSNAVGTTNLYQTPPVRTYGANLTITF